MCIDNSVPEVLREVVIIDAEFPLCTILADEVLIRGGFNKRRDRLYFSTEYEEQFTKLKFNKPVQRVDEKTGEKYISREFTLYIPDQYVPSSKECTHKNVIRTKEDIDNLYASMSKEES